MEKDIAMSSHVLAEFYRKVVHMRENQKEYERWKDSPSMKREKLAARKASESKVDAALVELSKVIPKQPETHQQSLFSSDFKPGVL